jgi:antitoxin component YwqK of YwqJK toxin-antitoxin module
MRDAEYKGGKFDGKVITYDRKGRVIEETFYKAGKKDGQYTKYNEKTGEVEQDMIYENGKVTKVKVQNGRPVK